MALATLQGCALAPLALGAHASAPPTCAPSAQNAHGIPSKFRITAVLINNANKRHCFWVVTLPRWPSTTATLDLL